MHQAAMGAAAGHRFLNLLWPRNTSSIDHVFAASRCLLGAIAVCASAAGIGLAHAQTPVTIQPPNLAGNVAGSIEGAAGVSPAGASSYSIPIKVPPGTAGVEPNLALYYDSRGSDGLLGLGWSISGLSKITRCPANLTVDLVPGRVGLDANDRYCLDGQRLLLVAGIQGAAGEYRTEVDGISRVTSFGSDPAIGPTSWKVETKSGRTLYYGGTADSFVEAQGTTKPLLWAVNRVEDKRGSYYLVQYSENTTTGEHYPTQIRYTGQGATLQPYAAVRFEYEPTARPDTVTRFVAGARTTIAKRLTKISTWINTAADGTGGTLVTETRLTYVVSPSSGRSLVSTVALCGATGLCLPATTFTSQQRTSAHNNFSATGSGVWGGPSAVFKTLSRQLGDVMRSVKQVDINGDGRTDLLKSFENGTWQVCLSTGSAFSCQTWNGPNKATDYVLTGDFNGDGRTDLFVPDASTGQVCLSTGSAFDCQTWPNTLGSTSNSSVTALGPSFRYLVADFTGDGRDDVMVLTSLFSTSRSLCKSTGTSFNCTAFNGPGYFDPHIADYTEPLNHCAINTTRWSPVMGDFNGDKRTDVLPASFQDPNCAALWQNPVNNSFDMCLAGDTAATCSTVVSGLGTRLGFIDPPGSITGDLNGDGYQDFVLQGLGTVFPGFMKVCLSNGAGGVSCTDYTPVSPENSDISHIADFDGDGRPDVLKYGNLCQAINGTLVCTPWTIPIAASPDELGPIYADFDGDGKTDLAFYNRVSTTWRVALAAGPTPDVVSSVTNGFGHTTQFDYKTLNASTVYTPGATTTYPKRNDNAGVAVVSQMRMANGIGGWLTTDYQFEANRIDMRGRGSLGFEKVRAIDRTREITGQTTSSQDFPYIGMPTEVRATQQNGVVLSRTTNTLASFVTAGSAVHPYISNSVVERKDLNGAVFPTLTTNITPSSIDIYGNVLVSTESVTSGSGTDAFATTTTNEYEVRTPTWLVGLLRKTTVTKTATLPSTPPLSPLLTLTGCTSTTLTTTPTAATLRCTVGNTGLVAASSIAYTVPASTTVSGPTTCAAATANCGTVTVTTATAVGTYSGALTATPTPAGTAASIAVSLTVNAGPPIVSASPTALSFGTVPKVGLANRSFTVTNTGGTTASISWALVYTAGTLAIADYSYNAAACTTLAAGASCTVTVTYGAQCFGGTRSATLSGQGSNFTTVAVTLTGNTSSAGTCNNLIVVPTE
jgi:hypothetical protein